MSKFAEIEDPLLRQLAEEQFSKRPIDVSLEVAFSIVASNRAGDEEALRAIAAAPVDQVVQYLYSNPGAEMMAAVLR